MSLESVACVRVDGDNAGGEGRWWEVVGRGTYVRTPFCCVVLLCCCVVLLCCEVIVLMCPWIVVGVEGAL